MILFLRNKRNMTIAEVECYVKSHEDEPHNKYIELHSSINIPAYSQLLLTNLERSDEIIADFAGIAELRGWLWEIYFMGKQNDPEEYNDVIKILRIHFENVMRKYDLIYVED